MIASAHVVNFQPSVINMKANQTPNRIFVRRSRHFSWTYRRRYAALPARLAGWARGWCAKGMVTAVTPLLASSSQRETASQRLLVRMCRSNRPHYRHSDSREMDASRRVARAKRSWPTAPSQSVAIHSPHKPPHRDAKRPRDIPEQTAQDDRSNQISRFHLTPSRAPNTPRPSGTVM